MGLYRRNKPSTKSILFIRLFSFLTLGIGIAGMLGWALGLMILTSFINGLIPMAPSTAFLFITFGTSVLLYSSTPKESKFFNVGIYLSAASTIIAFLLFILSFFGIHLPVEHLGFNIKGSIAGVPLGYISPLTAFCFVLSGLSFLGSLFSKRKKLIFPAFVFANIVFLISIVLLLAHLLGTPLLYATRYIPPALSTSLAFFFLGLTLILLVIPKVWKDKNDSDADLSKSTFFLILIFLFFSAGIVLAASYYYHHYELNFRLEKEQEISSIADLKIAELTHIRKDWIEDASLFYENPVFSNLVDRFLQNQKDASTYQQLRTWLDHFRKINNYNRLTLYDVKGIERLTLPEQSGPNEIEIKEKIKRALKSEEITIIDFYREQSDKRIYLNIFIPIHNPKNKRAINGLVSLRIDPELYIYPYIKSWPTSSKTSETILLRREGNNAIYLNELRLKQNTALSFYSTINNSHLLAIKAISGTDGIVEGYDYRNIHVLADIHHIPDSPWYIIAKVDFAEIYAPLNERFWLMIFLVAALLLSAGTAVGIIWRHQRIRFYEEGFETSEKLKESYELLERIFDNTHVMLAYLDPQFNFIRVNQAYAEADEHQPDFYPGKNHFALFPNKENEAIFHTVLTTGQPYITSAKPFEYTEHPERGVSYWDWSLQPVKASDGSITAFILSLINVTDRILAQKNVHKLNRVYALLSNINQTIIRCHDREQLFNEICRISIEDGKLRMVWIGIIDPQTKKIEIAASAGVTGNYLNNLKINTDEKLKLEGPCITTLTTGNYTISNDIASDEDMLTFRNDALTLGYRSLASFPIKVLGTIHGMINLYSDEVNFFTGEEIVLLDEMAMDVSFSLEFIEHEKKRKEAEEFLLKFRMGIERSGDAVFLTDPNGNIVYVNPAFEKIFGYTKEEVLGKTPRILKSGTLSQEYYSNFWRDLLTKKAVTHEIINKTKDDRLLSFEASVNPIISEQGEIIGYLAIERDITERKLIEKAMREHAEQFRAMISTTLFGFWLLDENGKILKVNDTYCQMSGYTREELLTFTLADLEVVENADDINRHINKIIETGVDQFETKHKAKDGRILDIEISTGYLYSQKQFIVFIKEITDRIRAEEEIISQKNKLAQLFDNSPIAIVLLNGNDEIVHANESFSCLFGYNLEDIKGRDLNALIVPRELHDEATGYSELTHKGNGINKESLRRKQDGTLINVQIIGVPISVNDITVGIYGMYVDLTQQKKAEKDLIAAKEKAEEMNRLKSNFLANMSHELRTPLNGILGYADILTTQFIEPEFIEMSKGIYQSGKRLSETLNLILDLSEAETGNIKMTAKDISVIPCVEVCLQSISTRAADKNLQLTTVIKEEKIIAHLDEQLFARILNNLLDNALKFTDTGEIRIEVGKEIMRGKLSLNSEEWVYIKIQDSGIGIPADKIDIIWQEFRQVSEGISRNYEGPGLGLTISKKAVELMGGEISVESALGVGSTFTIKFPTVEPQVEKEETGKIFSSPQNEREGFGSKDLPLVLYVEDDLTNRHIVQIFLGNEYRVETAENGKVALEMVAKKNYDFILMDINLGQGMNGMEVVKEIIKMPQYSSTPIVAVTAYATGDDRDEFMRGGCTHYISKPFEKRQLLELLASIKIK